MMFPYRVLMMLMGILMAKIGLAQITASIDHDGLSRTYELYVPSTWSPGQSLPLVFVLHGTTQTGNRIMDVSGFNAIAEAEQFIAVYPDGIGGSWNTGLVGASTADDLGLIEALADHLVVTHEADPLRVYSCGFSAGGYMSHRLACESSRCFAAIASVAGTMMPERSEVCAPLGPTPVMQIHGTADFIVAYGGGAIAGLGAEAVMARWNELNNCPGTPVITQLPNTNLLDLSTVEQQVYGPCDMNSSTVLLKVIGGGHQWPGTSVLLGGLGTINRDIDASAMIWDFFADRSCPDISTTVDRGEDHALQVGYDSTMEVIRVSGAIVSDPFTVNDAMGRTILHGTISNEVDRITLQGRPPGVYMLVIHGTRPATYRFVKP